MSVKRKGDLSIFNRDPPSCFSDRVARVRRSNTLEDRLLQDRLRTIHLEHTIRKRHLHKEERTLVKQLNGIHTVRETPPIGLQRRRLLQANAGNPILFHKASNTDQSVQKRARSAQPPSIHSQSPSHVTQFTAVMQYPGSDCRCSYTGYRVRRSPTISTSPDCKLPRWATFPLFPSSNESRETLGPNTTSETDSQGIQTCHVIQNAYVQDETQIGLNSFRLPTIDSKKSWYLILLFFNHAVGSLPWEYFKRFDCNPSSFLSNRWTSTNQTTLA